MTEPQPHPGEDMTETDKLVEDTGNGPQPDDPDDNPPQDPAWLPVGTETGDA